MLELEGYEVLTAENGRQGVEFALEDPPDLVLCDVMMPELDGLAVLQLLRENQGTATTPFIFLTARADWSDVRLGMNFGADDYLVKPVVRNELLTAVQVRLARSELVNERLRQSASGFNPDFSSAEPLQQKLGVTPRQAETLLWVAQGKSNADIAVILGLSEKTVKQHLGSVFQKIGVEGRNAAALRAVEILSQPRTGHLPG